MSHPVDRLSVHPVFYDALSREFRPDIDARGYAHSLGRLAYGTIERGAVVEEHEDQAIFDYEPTWAPNVTSSAICVLDQDVGRFSLTGLVLTHSSGLELAIHQTFRPTDVGTHFDRHVGVAIADADDYIQLFHAELPESFPSVSTRVVGYASKFFSRAHLVNSSSVSATD